MIDFTENGVHFHAQKGSAYAEKDGKELWSAMDVFVKGKPTKEAVLKLHNFIQKDFEKIYSEGGD